jgi:hypothetical protein
MCPWACLPGFLCLEGEGLGETLPMKRLALLSAVASLSLVGCKKEPAAATTPPPSSSPPAIAEQKPDAKGPDSTLTGPRRMRVSIAESQQLISTPPGDATPQNAEVVQRTAEPPPGMEGKPCPIVEKGLRVDGKALYFRSPVLKRWEAECKKGNLLSAELSIRPVARAGAFLTVEVRQREEAREPSGPRTGIYPAVLDVQDGSRVTLGKVLTAPALEAVLQSVKAAMSESKDERFTPVAGLADAEVLSRIADNFVLLNEGGRMVLRTQLTTYEDGEHEESSALVDFELPPTALQRVP